jgi:hypothetical protein
MKTSGLLDRLAVIMLAACAGVLAVVAAEPFGRGARVTASTTPQVVTFPGAVRTCYVANLSATVWVYVAKNALTNQWGWVMAHTNALPLPPESTLALGGDGSEIRYLSIGTLSGSASVAIGGE